ncbi:hypothetical protein Tco_1485513 [Tanacetum coccineum]
MLTTSSWIRKSAELTLKYSVRFFRSVPDSLTKILWNLLQNKIYLHLSRNLVTLASVTCYLPFELIKYTSLGGHLLLSLTEFMYQVDNREISSARKQQMPYPRFTKVIIDHFISKYNSISMRNRINLHTARDDSLLAYKTYLDYATRKVPPKKERKFKKPASPKLKTVPTSPKEPTQKGKRVKRLAKKATTTPSTGVVIRDTPNKSVSNKITPTKTDRGKGIELLSDAALLEDAQLKKTLRKSKKETHKLQASGSSEGADFELEVPVMMILGGNNEDENDDFNDEDDDGGNDDDSSSNDDGDNNAHDSEQTDSDDDDENPSFTLKNYKEEEHDEEYVFTPEKDKFNDEEKMYEEEDDDVAKELYGDLNITQGLRDTDMTNVEQGGEDQQNTSHEFGKLLNVDNTSPNVNEISSLVNTLTVPPSPPPVNPSSHRITTPQQQTPESTTTTTNPITTLPEIPNFASLFGFEQRASALETKMSEFNQTSQFVEVVSSISGIVDQYLASKMKEAMDVAVRIQSNKLKEETEAENQEFINQVESTMKAIIKEQVKAQVSKVMPQIEKYVTTSLVVEVLVRSTKQPQTSYAVAF